MDEILYYNDTNSTAANSTGGLSTPLAVKVMRIVFITIFTILVIFGVAGNILTIIVLSSKKLNTSSTSFYLSALALVDLFYLVVTLSSKMVDFFIFPTKARSLHEVVCRLSPMIHYFMTYFSCWLLVAVTIDRMIWVVFPFHAKKICTRHNSVIITTIIGFLAFGGAMHFLFTMSIVNYNGMKVCIPDPTTGQIFPYVDLVLAMGGPFAIMLVSNTMIIIKMGRVARTRKKNLRKNSNRNDDKTHSLTTMLLCVSFFFMGSTTPLLIYDIVFFAIDINAYTTDPTIGSIVYGVEQTCYVFWYLNYAIHFLLYCLSGPRFREEAKRLFGIAQPSYTNGSQKVRGDRNYEEVRSQLTKL